MSKQYLYRVDILNRKNPHPLESICYYSGENQYDISNGKQYTSNTSEKVIWNSILIPKKEDNPKVFSNLPEYLKFRSQKKDIISNARNILWQNINTREVREDAQFSRVFEISIPGFLNHEQAVEALERFAKPLIDAGMIADGSIHSRDKNLNVSLLDRLKNNIPEEKESENNSDYRGFLICTLRDYKNGMFVNKNRDWNSKKQLEDWRRSWVEILCDLVDNATLTPEEKKEWDKKLSIYSEYDTIRKMKDILATTQNKSLKMI